MRLPRTARAAPNFSTVQLPTYIGVRQISLSRNTLAGNMTGSTPIVAQRQLIHPWRACTHLLGSTIHRPAANRGGQPD
jgi:hypothetical protein